MAMRCSVDKRASSMNLTDASSPFLPLPEGIAIAFIHPEADSVVVHITCHLPISHCPGCGHPSERIHGSYVRTVADLPCGGRRVILKFSVRKFVCGTSTCPRRIFTERLSALVQYFAPMTNPFTQAPHTPYFSPFRVLC